MGTLERAQTEKRGSNQFHIADATHVKYARKVPGTEMKATPEDINMGRRALASDIIIYYV